MNAHDPGRTLAEHAAAWRFEDIPAPVVRRAEDLFLDWFGSALAGRQARPVETIARFAERMGPADGPAEILIHRRGSSPLAAAMANALRGRTAMPSPVPEPGRANAIACARYLPGRNGTCTWSTDPRGSGLAVAGD